VEDGSIQLREGRASDPDVVLTTDDETFADIASGKTTGSSATATGTMTVTGDPQAARRVGKILSRQRVLQRAEAVVRAARQRG
jgi:putative sterol carrier protein